MRFNIKFLSHSIERKFFNPLMNQNMRKLKEKLNIKQIYQQKS